MPLPRTKKSKPLWQKDVEAGRYSDIEPGMVAASYGVGGVVLIRDFDGLFRMISAGAFREWTGNKDNIVDRFENTIF